MTRLTHQGIRAERDRSADRLNGCVDVCALPGGWAVETVHMAFRPAGYHPTVRLILVCRACGSIKTSEVND